MTKRPRRNHAAGFKARVDTLVPSLDLDGVKGRSPEPTMAGSGPTLYHEISNCTKAILAAVEAIDHLRERL